MEENNNKETQQDQLNSMNQPSGSNDQNEQGQSIPTGEEQMTDQQTQPGNYGYQEPQYQSQNFDHQNSNQQNSYNKNQYGQNPYNQNPYSQNPYNQNLYSQNSYNQNQYNQNPYRQNNQNPYQQYNNYQEPGQPQNNGMAIGSLVCGIIGGLLSCCYYISLPLSIVSIVLGIIVLKKKKGGKNLAIVGIILGGITVLIAGIFLIASIYMFSGNNMYYNDFMQEYKNILDGTQSSIY